MRINGRFGRRGWGMVCLVAWVVARPAGGECEFRWEPGNVLPQTLAVSEMVRGDVGDGEALYVAGHFRIGQGSGWGVMRWSGDGWGLLGEAQSYPIYALAVHKGTLFAGGELVVGGEACGLARWTGAAWEPACEGLPGFVTALWVHEGKLIAGMALPASFEYPPVWSWNGEVWSALGEELRGTIAALTTWNGRLVAGGSLWPPGSRPDGLAIWDGASWEILPESFNFVRELAVFQDDLFYVAGSGQAGSVRRWDGVKDVHLLQGYLISGSAVLPAVFPSVSWCSRPILLDHGGAAEQHVVLSALRRVGTSHHRTRSAHRPTRTAAGTGDSFRQATGGAVLQGSPPG